MMIEGLMDLTSIRSLSHLSELCNTEEQSENINSATNQSCTMS